MVNDKDDICQPMLSKWVMVETYDFSVLTGLEFEKIVANMLIRFGYKDVKNRRGTADGGIDVEAMSVTPISTNSIAIQCKRYADNKVRLHHVRNLDSAVKNEDFTSGVIITSGEFTSTAVEFAEKSSVKIRLIDGQELTRLLQQAFPNSPSLPQILNLSDNDLRSSSPVFIPGQSQIINQTQTSGVSESVESDIQTSNPKDSNFSQYDPLDTLPHSADEPLKIKKKIDDPTNLLGHVIEVNNRKFPISSMRQLENIDTSTIGLSCPSCDFPLREGNYCLFEDWIFSSIQLQDDQNGRINQYCKHHPSVELTGRRLYCGECDWHYSN